MSLRGVAIRENDVYVHYVREEGHHCMQRAHIHDDYEIYFLLSGERIYWIDNQTYVVPEGSIVFINRNILHRTVASTKPVHERYVLNFRPDFLPSYCADKLIHVLFEKGPLLLQLTEPMKTSLQTLMQRMLHEYHSNEPHARLYVQSLLMQLLLQCKQFAQEKRSVSLKKNNDVAERNNQVAMIIDYVHIHFKKQMTLRQIADHFYLSDYYLSRLFKAVTGMKLMEYVTLVRVFEAQKLLRQSAWKIGHIARHSGFPTTSHFNRVFKDVTTLTPSEYRHAYDGATASEPSNSSSS